jgi:excisionase family DNA binding protein
MTESSEPEWLTIPEIARRLRVGQMTVYRICQRGELASHRVGRQFRVKAADFAAYLANIRNEAS